MKRDLDYAAVAVQTAIQNKFSRHRDLSKLKVEALELTIRISLNDHETRGSRDQLLALVRNALDLDAIVAATSE